MTKYPGHRGIPARRGGSLVRLLCGLGLCVAALAMALTGGVQLARVLEAGGYGTPAQRAALIVLGIAGACLSAGIATVIWDISKRYEG